ncbi:MAG: polysaccharide export protein [Symploca sp. SIO1C4]|uniref:Polysaccharide export protein n=1 Tax=Symploca sp. SIO1C4 TaxID=2607765 RepID=A0A6B3NFU8_9CYAN|nr:polysaccharide export protein [Symploca sp. SIO1C4]
MLKLVKYFIIGAISTTALILTSSEVWALPLSPGDRLRLFIPGEEDLPNNERFSATYEVNLDGMLNVPYLEPFSAAGKEISEVEAQIKQALITGGFFQPQSLLLSLEIFEWAPIQVSVGGAVFYPGRVLINETESKGRELPAQIATLSGDYPPERYLTAAILAAGGVKPNADISQVRLLRGKQEQVLDLSGEFTGAPVEDVPLIAGDQIIVPDLDSTRNELVRLSQITPETITVYLSNLTSPNPDEVQTNELPYGSRFSQAVVVANCLGGSSPVNSKRRVLLVQTDRQTGETKTFESKVEDLLENSADPTVNPFLMPEDSVACYDSTVSNVNNVFNVLRNVLNPIRLLQDIFSN